MSPAFPQSAAPVSLLANSGSETENEETTESDELEG
ncbi:hypothetical protein SLEP1_g54504 [Rubroshorea leprosula]|uniref:Uncharacterized protein n=1 Tax=Rubroshorea leprosula TaxID=152421 RepID=A0AAV5MCL7_9ROSI|nr:hypothetical protein SLEP1_g54504 [Rubroshorea leprosula]